MTTFCETFCVNCNDTTPHYLDLASTDDAFCRYLCDICGHKVLVPNENRGSVLADSPEVPR